MLILSDVHAEFDALREVASQGQPLLILGDLINFIDYRTYDGILAEVLGRGLVREIVDYRAAGDYEGSRRLWQRVTEGKQDEVRAEIDQKVRRQYAELSTALAGAVAYVTFGNVDWPDLLRDSLPAGSRFLDGQVVEIEGWKVGFAGGGAPSPLGVPGEVPSEELAAKLEGLGDVDVLCTHMAPSIPALHYDVVAGISQRSSTAILDYIEARQPKFHYFGDIHQPRASQWRIGRTKCRNVGYFRATRRAVAHPGR
ncbi:MAG: metallophosphoesterase [Acidimicrobiia bacterium]